MDETADGIQWEHRLVLDHHVSVIMSSSASETISRARCDLTIFAKVCAPSLNMAGLSALYWILTSDISEV